MGPAVARRNSANAGLAWPGADIMPDLDRWEGLNGRFFRSPARGKAVATAFPAGK